MSDEVITPVFSGNLEKNEDRLSLILRLLLVNETDGSHFPDGHSAQLDQRPHGQVLNPPVNISFEHVPFDEIASDPQRQQRADEEAKADEHEYSNFEMIGLLAHAACLFRKCRTQDWAAWLRKWDGGPSATMPRALGSSMMTRLATA